MTSRPSKLLLRPVAVAAALCTMTVLAAAQPGPRWDMPGPGMMLGPGGFGPGMGGPRGFGRMCHPGAAGFAEWRIDRLERTIRPTEAQKVKLEELKAAAAKAAETMRNACPTEWPATMVGRLESMEKRLEVMLEAVKTMRPALEAFYATLTDEQKAQFDRSRGPGRFWRWRWRDRE